MNSHPHKLTPNEALSAAGSIYDFKNGSTVTESFKTSKVSNLFDFSKSTEKFSAKSGMFEFKNKAGFAAIAAH